MTELLQSDNLIIRTFEWLQDNVAGHLVNFTIAIIIMLIGFIMGRFLGKLTFKLLKSFELDKLLGQRGKFSYSNVISRIFSYTTYFITTIIALGQLGIISTVAYVVLGIVFIVVFLSVFLGFLDFVPNLFASILLYNRRIFEVGDIIEFGKIKGTVSKFNFMETQITTKEGDILHIPNLHLQRHKIKVIKKK